MISRTISSTVSTGGALPAVAKKVYATLTVGLLFSALMGNVAMHLTMPWWMPLVAMLSALPLIIIQRWARTGVAGMLVAFSIMGVMGFAAGPLVNQYLHMANGGAIVMQALTATAAIFGGLSLYAIISKKDFSFLRGFLFVGLLVMIVMGLIAAIFHIHALSMAYSAGVALIMSGYILYDTSEMLKSGENDYLLIVTALFLDVFNLFLSLLNLLSNIED